MPILNWDDVRAEIHMALKPVLERIERPEKPQDVERECNQAQQPRKYPHYRLLYVATGDGYLASMTFDGEAIPEAKLLLQSRSFKEGDYLLQRDDGRIVCGFDVKPPKSDAQRIITVKEPA